MSGPRQPKQNVLKNIHFVKTMTFFFETKHAFCRIFFLSITVKQRCLRPTARHGDLVARLLGSWVQPQPKILFTQKNEQSFFF